MQKCILRLIVDNGLYDSMTDCLLTFPEREREFMGFSIQAHTQMLGEISEQVSGFKQKILIEISTHNDEARLIYQHVKSTLTEASFETQLYPLLELDHQ